MTITHAERIVSEAEEALTGIDREVQSLRDEKLLISGKIAALLNERKPLARIVSAAAGRKANGNGTTGSE